MTFYLRQRINDLRAKYEQEARSTSEIEQNLIALMQRQVAARQCNSSKYLSDYINKIS